MRGGRHLSPWRRQEPDERAWSICFDRSAHRSRQMIDLRRRHLIAGLLASSGLAASAGASRLFALAQSASTGKPFRIDIHHHFAPPAWVTAVKGRPLLQPANTTWTPEKSIEDMDRGGVAASMVSITNPGLWFGDAPMTKQL